MPSLSRGGIFFWSLESRAHERQSLISVRFRDTVNNWFAVRAVTALVNAYLTGPNWTRGQGAIVMNGTQKILRALAITAIPAALALTATAASATPSPPNGTDIGGCVDDADQSRRAIACAGYYSWQHPQRQPGRHSQSAELRSHRCLARSPGTATGRRMDGSDRLGRRHHFAFRTEQRPARLRRNPVRPGDHRRAFRLTFRRPQGNVSVFWLFNLTAPTNFITLDRYPGFVERRRSTPTGSPG